MLSKLLGKVRHKFIHYKIIGYHYVSDDISNEYARFPMHMTFTQYWFGYRFSRFLTSRYKLGLLVHYTPIYEDSKK